MNKSDIAREWRRKHPETPSLKLARLIMTSKDSVAFKSVEDARYRLRYIEGKTGLKRKQHIKDTPFVKDEPRPYNPYKIPASDESEYTPFVITGHKRLAVFSDIHVPYHSIEAITAAVKFCKKEKPDGLLLNGDSIDFYRLSRFSKDPRKRNFAGELDTFKALIEVFERELNCKIYFKVGNHEERYEKFMMEKAGELIGIEEFELENIIKSRVNGIQMINGKQIMQAGGLNILHGHEFGQSVFSPVNIARGLYMKGKVSAIQGHNHRTSSHTEKNMNQKIVTTWSLGCLCELTPEYLPINQWNHGFAMVDLDGGEFHVRNMSIYKGKVY